MVNYEVQIRPINPRTQKPIHNDGTYATHLYKEGDVLEKAKDCILYLKVDALKVQSGFAATNADQCAKLDGDFWQTYFTTQSLPHATQVAKTLVAKYGLENVKVCKITPISTVIVFSEE